MIDLPLTGGCNCGAVRYEVTPPLLAAGYCHCNPHHADPIGIRMGTFDDDPGIAPSVHQFVAYAAPWEPIPDDGLPRHPESRHAPAEPR